MGHGGQVTWPGDGTWWSGDLARRWDMVVR